MRLCLLAVALLQAVTATNRTFCFSYVECFERAQKELKECSGGTAWALTLESRDKTIADLIKGRQALISTCQDHLVKEVVDFDTLQVLVNEDARECFTKLPATSRKYDYNNLNCKYEAETKDRDHYGKDPYQCALEFISDRHTCEKLLDCCSDHSRCAERMNAVSMAYQHAKLKSNQIVSNVLTCVVSNDPTSGELVNRLQGQRPSLRYPGLPFFTPDLVTEERVNRRLALTSHAALDRRRQRFNRRYHQVRSLFTQQWESLFRTEQRRTGLTIPAARRISIVKNLLKNAKEEELAQYVTLIADGNFVRLAELERQKVGRLQNEEQVDEAMDKMKKIRDAIKAALEVKEKKNPKRAVAAAHNVQEIPRPEFETVPVPSVEDVVMKAMAEVDSETLNRAKKFANAAGKALQERKKNIQARSSFSIDGIPDTRTAEMNHNLDGAPVHEFSTLNQRNMKPPQTIGGSMQPLSESRMVSMARAATTHSAANKKETEDTKESEALTPVVTEDEPAKKIKLDKAKNEEKVDASSNKSEETIKNSENSDETDEDSDAEVKKVEKEEEKEVEEKEPKKETETKEKSDSTDEKKKENDEEEEKDNKKKEKEEKKEKEDENEEKKVKEVKEDVNEDKATEEAKKDKQVVEEDLEKEEKPKKEKKVKKEEKPDDKDSVTEKPKEDEDTSANGAEEQEEESTTAKKEDKKEESAKPAKKEKKHKRTKKTAKKETDEEKEESKSETEESSKKETSVKETSEEPTKTKDSKSEDSGKETKKNDSNKKSTDIEKEGEKTETVPSEKEGEKEEENEETEEKKEKEGIDEDDKGESPETKESDEKKEEKPKKSKKSQENEAKKSATASDEKAEVKEEKKSKKSKTEEKEEESEPKTDEEIEKDTEGTEKTDEVATVVEEADDEEEKVASKDDKMSKLSEELKMTSDALKRSIDDEFEEKPSKGSRIGGLAGKKKHHKERIVESKDTEDEETEKKEKVITPAAKALMKKIISEMKKTVKEEKKTEKEDTSDSLESASESMESEDSSSMAQSEEKEETSTKQAENSDEDSQASEEQVVEKTVSVKLDAKVVHDGESKGSRHCRVFANCEETVRDYEEQCHRRYSPDILAHGIEDAEILSILVNSSSTNHEIVMKACLRPLDKALHSTLRQLFIIQRGVRKACLSLGRNKKDMDDHEKAMCSTEIPSTAAIDEFLAAHQLRSEEAFYTCQALLSPVRDSCNAIQPCCASIPPCDRFIANSEVRKMRDEAVSRLVKKQNACETRMLDTLRALRAEIGPNGELIRRRRFL